MNAYRLLRNSGKFIVILTLLCFFFLPGGAQNNTTKSNFRFSFGLSDFKGIYFLSEAGFPICRYLEISPSIIYATTLPYSFKSVSITKDDYSSTGIINDHSIHGYTLGALNLSLVLKPFSLLNSTMANRHQLGIGSGVSLNFYSITDMFFNETTNNIEALSVKTNRDIGIYYLNFYYLYKFVGNISLGIKGAMLDLDGEPIVLIGITAGIDIH